MRIGILTDYPSVAHIAGPAIHTRFLKHTLERRGHSVVLMGPDTDADDPVPGESHLYPSRSYPTHPKVKIPLPADWDRMWQAPRVDLVHSQTNTHMICYANWMRRMWGIPVINTHTVHLESYAHFMVSERLSRLPSTRRTIGRLAHGVNRSFARMYNQGDALVVQAAHLAEEWRSLGVTVPIHVIERPCDPAKFSRPPGADPFPVGFARGRRLIVVCRHDREKRLDHLLRIFATQVAPHDPAVTLTLVGDGLAHHDLIALADRLPFRDRVYFTGLLPHGELVDWYRHADAFAYTSLSETFGNVVNEALWCGLPVVALDDGMGVAHQVIDGVNGRLIAPDGPDTDGAFAAACLELVDRPDLRLRLGATARERARRITHPDVIAGRIERLYADARMHCRGTVRRRLTERSVLRQKASLARHLAVWGAFNSTLLAAAEVGVRLDGGRRNDPRRHAPLRARDGLDRAAV